MKNPQRPWPRSTDDGTTLSVHSIFPTIQGEGPHAGRPAVFVRLAGCNLQCPLCDTEYTTGAKDLPVDHIVDQVAAHAGYQLVVITGGEPFRQCLGPLATALLARGISVQIETNGMLPARGALIDELIAMDALDIVISPKTARIDHGLASAAVAFKYVVQAGAVAPDGLPITALGHLIPVGAVIARPPEDFDGTIYVQPADEKSVKADQANMRAAVASVLMAPFGQRKLCLQLHKYAGLE